MGLDIHSIRQQKRFPKQSTGLWQRKIDMISGTKKIERTKKCALPKKKNKEKLFGWGKERGL